MGAAGNTAVSRAERSHGRYELGSELARGGMGIVYRAYDQLARREIAYKRLHVEGQASHARAAGLFEREYAALMQLTHPSIVQVYEYGIDAYAPYYTMELLSGRDLFEAAPMPVATACALLRQIASALALIHARRLVHRDISPANVRLTSDGKAKLIDFGALTGFGLSPNIVGTPAFVAPECLTTRQLDGRTDLFSFGAVAYWSLTRRTPFSARSLEQRLADLNAAVLPPSMYLAAIPKELDELVLSLLHPDPLARPDSAVEVMQRLTAIADLPPEEDERQVAFSYLAHPPLFGRDEERERTRALLKDATPGRARTAVLQGAPGLGRTALLDQLAIDAQLAGRTVLRAQGGAHARAFGVAQALVRTGLAMHPRVDAPPMSVLPMLPSSGTAGPAASPVDAARRHARTLTALQSCLLEVAHQAPLAILIDDAHRVDTESLALLVSLAQGTEESSLVIVLTVSSEGALDASAPLAKLLSTATLISLHPLRAEHILELVHALFGSVPNVRRVARFLNERCNGTPTKCMDLLRLLLQRGVVHYANGTFALPHDISEDAVAGYESEAQLTRLHELSENAQTLARVLSIQDVDLSLDVVAAACGLDGPALVLALDELRASGVLNAAEDELALASDTIRAAVQATLDEPTRRALHMQVAHSLRALGERSTTVDLLIGANLMRGGDEAAGVELLSRALRRRWYELSRDATPIPLLEAVLEAMHKQGRSDEQCVAMLVPLVRAGFSADYLVQLRYLDRALAALSKLCGMTLANRLRPYFGQKGSLFVALGIAALRFAFIPRSRRLASFRDALIALLTIATAGAAAAVSAFDSAKARELLEKLKPLEGFPAGTAPNVSYQFALAAYEIGSGQGARGAARYAELSALLKRGPVPDLDEEAHTIFRLGCQYGQAQGAITRNSPLALTFAAELEGAHPFYAPHAESTRMAYYALRGEQEKAELYRERAELAALRGGTSWTSVTVLTVRSMYAYIWWRNPIGLAQLIPELARLARTAPNLGLYRDIAEACVKLMRRQAAEAVALFESVLSDPRHAAMPTVWQDTTFYANALCAVGRHEEAVKICTELVLHDESYRDDVARQIPVLQLAMAEAGLGKLDEAAARVDKCLAELDSMAHALLRGSLHRDRATIALWAGDERKFQEHHELMSQHFRETQNPWLIRQCEQLAAEAQHVRSGGSLASLPNLLAPSNQPPPLTDSVTFITATLPGSEAITAKRSDSEFEERS